MKYVQYLFSLNSDYLVSFFFADWMEWLHIAGPRSGCRSPQRAGDGLAPHLHSGGWVERSGSAGHSSPTRPTRHAILCTTCRFDRRYPPSPLRRRHGDPAAQRNPWRANPAHGADPQPAPRAALPTRRTASARRWAVAGLWPCHHPACRGSGGTLRRGEGEKVAAAKG